MAAGKVPVSLLKERSKFHNRMSCPSESGMSPSNAFVPSSRDVSKFRLEMSSGMGPLSSFSVRSKIWRCFGIACIKRGPVRWFMRSRRSTSFDRCLRWSEMGPCKLQLERSSSSTSRVSGLQVTPCQVQYEFSVVQLSLHSGNHSAPFVDA